MNITRSEVLMVGGIELTQEAERHVHLDSTTKLLSVACGTGELELYLVRKYNCETIGVDKTVKFIKRANEKLESGTLDVDVKFEVGDGNSLMYESGSFDIIFCCGSICAFYYNGLKEFRRLLKPRGKVIIIEAIWRQEDIPEDVEKFWTKAFDDILTVKTAKGHLQAFENHGFCMLFSKEYHKPEWWDAYYDDRGEGPEWQKAKTNYQAQQDYIGIGLFILEKAASSHID